MPLPQDLPHTNVPAENIADIAPIIRDDEPVTFDDSDNNSIASWDVIPSPHHRISSINGPPRWHEEHRNFQGHEFESGWYLAEIPQIPHLDISDGRHHRLDPKAIEFVPAPNTKDRTNPPEILRISQGTVDIVEALLNPPAYTFRQRCMATIQLPWVRKVVGQNLVFDSTPGVNRQVLSKFSPLRTYGLALGLPVEFYRWLGGIEEQARINEFKIPIKRLEQGRATLAEVKEGLTLYEE
ncbi:hypothetical protein B0J11DRAFT_576849 [Dendryphion nanum]|uniref:Uncharacterized protein n=1 Tax=Dendryphion nanum TaxID=256645 RepID=A0A9P9ISQ2_9PLEO|nr:hypothetical protein B0J11DRAFT_576849 [Dendryphion nanum]